MTPLKKLTAKEALEMTNNNVRRTECILSSLFQHVNKRAKNGLYQAEYPVPHEISISEIENVMSALRDLGYKYTSYDGDMRVLTFHWSE